MVQGDDITQVDAVVNAAGTALRGGGVDCAIHRGRRPNGSCRTEAGQRKRFASLVGENKRRRIVAVGDGVSVRSYSPVMAKLKPTDEQVNIVDAAKTGANLVIQAGAGTGKTSTLKLVAAEQTRHKTLYIAYNRAIAKEAGRSFPSHVDCRTAHSLAYGAVGRHYAHRLNGPRELPSRRAEILGTRLVNLGQDITISAVQLARIAIETVTRFCYSADDDLSTAHVPHQNGVVGPAHHTLAQVALPYARKAWADITSSDGLLKFQHDHYLKMWVLTHPKLPTDVIMLDEAQDSNPVVAQLVQSQTHAQLIAVGDSNQSMYQWRGACDALGSWPADIELFLSRSWRFGPAIAAEANRWLNQIDTPLRLTGNPAIRSQITSLDHPHAILCRTNAEAITRVIALLTEGRKVALAGGGADIRRLAQAATELKNGGRTNHPELYVFATWGALQEYVETDHAGRDLKPFVDLIDAHGPDAIVEAIDALVDEDRSDTVISTAHKSKGREWDSVLIADDFAEPLGHNDIPETDAMLAYVAVTRARWQLDRSGLAWIDKYSTRRPPQRSWPNRQLDNRRLAARATVSVPIRGGVPPYQEDSCFLTSTTLT